MKSGYDFLTVAGRSDTGRVRGHNEDSIKVERDAGWFCVADGMGGEEAGDVASREVVEAIRAELALLPDAAGANNLAKKEHLVCRAIQKANARIRIYVKKEGLRQSGSTLVFIGFDLSQPGRCTVLHAGDSRLYRFAKGALSQVTKDHSVAEAAGVKNENDIPLMFRGMITRAIGIKAVVEPEIQYLDFHPGDTFLLCSDGLSGMLNDRKIRQVLASQKHSLEEKVDRLIDQANQAGGKDNISVILVHVDQGLQVKAVDAASLKNLSIPEDSGVDELLRDYESFSDEEAMISVGLDSRTGKTSGLASKLPTDDAISDRAVPTRQISDEPKAVREVHPSSKFQSTPRASHWLRHPLKLFMVILGLLALSLVVYLMTWSLKKPWQVYVAPPDSPSTPPPLNEGSIDVIPGEPGGLSPGQDSNDLSNVSSPLSPAGLDRRVPGSITERADWASTNIVNPASSPGLVPAPLEPVPLEPVPDEPVPDEPVPLEPVPLEPVPDEPAPLEPAPLEPVPDEPVPDEPAPLEPAPLEPAPLESVPLEPVPDEPAPLEPVPLVPAPDESAPLEPVPPESSTVEPIGGYPPFLSPVTSER
jgi:protein phosphatase